MSLLFHQTERDGLSEIRWGNTSSFPTCVPLIQVNKQKTRQRACVLFWKASLYSQCFFRQFFSCPQSEMQSGNEEIGRGRERR